MMDARSINPTQKRRHHQCALAWYLLLVALVLPSATASSASSSKNNKNNNKVVLRGSDTTRLRGRRMKKESWEIQGGTVTKTKMANEDFPKGFMWAITRSSGILNGEDTNDGGGFAGSNRKKEGGDGTASTKVSTATTNMMDREIGGIVNNGGGLVKESIGGVMKNKNKCRKPKAAKLPPPLAPKEGLKEPIKPGGVGVAPAPAASVPAAAAEPTVDNAVFAGVIGGGDNSASSISRAIDPTTGEEEEEVVDVEYVTSVYVPPIEEEADEEDELMENICDENGNLLPGEVSYAPTITPSENDNDNNGGEDIIDGKDVIDSESTADNDSDGLTNGQESTLGTDPNNPDTDSDGLSDSQEVFLGTDPLKQDSDGDGYDDYNEVMDGSDPLDETDHPTDTATTSNNYNGDVIDEASTADTDGDGILDANELVIGTDVNNPDTDGDGLTDGLELDINTDPLLVDTDFDTLTDYQEVMFHGTNPLKNDTDGDGLSDAFEVENGLDPLTSNTNMGDSLAVSPGCDAWMAEEVYTTNIPARVNFVYEVALDDGIVDATEVTDGMEKNMARLVGRDLIKCDLDLLRNRQLLDSATATDGHQSRRHLVVDGIDPAPPDIVLTQRTCSYYTADNPETPTNTNCYVIQGLMTLYLRENTALSSTSESSSKALKTLLEAMNNDDPSPFVDYSGNGDYSTDGVKAVRYMKGTPDEGGMVLIDNSGNQGVGNGGAAGATTANTDGDDGNLSPVGIALIALGAVGIILVALVAARSTRKRKNQRGPDNAYAEFYDDENDLDMKHHGYGADAMTDVDATSLNGTPSPKKKRAYYPDEDDSIFAGLGATTPGGTNYNEEEEDDDDGPTFVHTHDYGHGDAGSTAMTAEQGYEFGYSPGNRGGNYDNNSESSSSTNTPPSPPGALQFSADSSSAYYGQQEIIPQYTPKVELTSPRYENPSVVTRQSPGGNGRVYYVGDTVEF